MPCILLFRFVFMRHSPDELNKKRGTYKFVKVVEMIGWLKEKYPAAAKLYDVEVIPDRYMSISMTSL